VTRHMVRPLSVKQRIAYNLRESQFATAMPPLAKCLGEHARPGSLLHHVLDGKPMIVVGNSSSLNRINMGMVREFPTLGCNRILQMYEPEFYTVVDRQPYIQEIERIKQYRGTRVLSETLFDPMVSCRRQPVQPPPTFPWYRYRAVASSNPFPPSNPQRVYTHYTNDRRVHCGMMPSVRTNLDEWIPGGANIAVCMLQIAMAMGANPIGVAGVDMSWKSPQDSHFFGAGSSVGAFRFNTRRVMLFFAAIARWAKEHHIEILNLSPEGVLSPTFPRMSVEVFHSRFIGQVQWKGVRPWELSEFATDRHGPALPVGTALGCEPNLAPVSYQMGANQRLHRPPPRNLTAELVGRSAAALERARRLRIQGARARKGKRG